MQRKPEAETGSKEQSAYEKYLLETLNKEKQTVLSQPHRNGSTSQLRASALGCFVEDYECGIECYHAGREYMIVVWKYRLAVGVPVPQWVREEFGGSGAEMDAKTAENFADTVKNWRSTVVRCRNCLQRDGIGTYAAVEDLIFKDIKPSVAKVIKRVKHILHELAIELGKFPY